MEPVIDFLAEAKLWAAEQIVAEIFDVRDARQCRTVIGRNDSKARKAGKHARIAELVRELKAKDAQAGW